MLIATSDSGEYLPCEPVDQKTLIDGALAFPTEGCPIDRRWLENHVPTFRPVVYPHNSSWRGAGTRQAKRRQNIIKRYQEAQWRLPTGDWPPLSDGRAVGFQVMCNCDQQGKAKDPPFPRALISYEDGFPDLRFRGFAEYEDLHEAFLDWRQRACEHRHMVYARTGTGCRNAVEEFLLDRVDDSVGFGLIRKHRDIANYRSYRYERAGSLRWHYSFGPEKIDDVLSEIESDCKRFVQTRIPELVDAQTGQVIFDGLESYTNSGLGLWNHFRLTGDLDERGFHLRENWIEGCEVFCSKQFEETLLEPSEDGVAYGVVEYRDLASDKRQICAVPHWLLPPTRNVGSTRRLRVQDRTEEAVFGQIGRLLDPLREICYAARETGNPVHGCM